MSRRKAALRAISADLDRIAANLDLVRGRVASLYRDWTQDSDDDAPAPRYKFEFIDRTGQIHYECLRKSDPVSRRTVEQIDEWRRREKRHDVEPIWGQWAEFTVALGDGSRCIVVYKPAGFSGCLDNVEWIAPFVEPGFDYPIGEEASVLARASGLKLRDFVQQLVLQLEVTLRTGRPRKAPGNGPGVPVAPLRAIGTDDPTAPVLDAQGDGRAS